MHEYAKYITYIKGLLDKDRSKKVLHLNDGMWIFFQ